MAETNFGTLIGRFNGYCESSPPWFYFQCVLQHIALKHLNSSRHHFPIYSIFKNSSPYPYNLYRKHYQHNGMAEDKKPSHTFIAAWVNGKTIAMQYHRSQSDSIVTTWKASLRSFPLLWSHYMDTRGNLFWIVGHTLLWGFHEHHLLVQHWSFHCSFKSAT